MLATILAILGAIGDFGIKLWKSMGPSPIVVESEKAGMATEQVAVAQKAVVAETAVAQAEIDAPTTLAGVEDTMTKGAF